MVVIGIVSAKGGTGKTTLATNLGVALVKKLGKKVVLVDGNISTPSAGVHLGILSQEKTLHDVLKGAITMDQAVYVHTSGLFFIPSSLSIDGSIDPELLKDKIDSIKGQYDYVIIDGAGGVDREAISTIKSSDFVLIVANPDMVSVLAAVKIIKMAKNCGIAVLGIVINKYRNKKHEVTPKKIEELCETNVIATVPFDKRLPEIISQMTPIIMCREKSPAAKSFIDIASYLVGAKIEEKKSILQKMMEMIFRRKTDARQ